MATTPVMPENLTAAQMKEWIEANPQPTEAAPEVEYEIVDPETGEPVVTDQPRDERGRFVATTPEGVTPEGEEPEQLIVRDEIDLGDGSGIQVFEGIGATVEEARADQVAKLLEAQKNATRKIRQQEAAIKSVQKPEPQLTPDEELALSQRLLSNPSQVLKEAKEQAKREALEELRRQQEAERQAAEEAHNAATTFVQNNPDFYPCPENQERIERYMKLYDLPKTLDGINQAYAAVKDILKTKPEEPTTPKPRSSTISTRRSAPVTTAQPSAAEREKAFAEWCESQGVTPPAPIRRKF